MARYMNGVLTKIVIDGVSYRASFQISATAPEDTVLISSDGYVLTEANGAYITVMEDD